MGKKKILYISQEITPYLKPSELGKLCQNLPHKVQEHGIEVRTFMPKYGCINERRNQLHEVIRLSGMNLVIDDTDHPLIIKVATLQSSRMQVYFIDNDERMMFFVRGVMETVKKLRWEPVVVHCSGWVTALAPIYMKKLYADDPTIGPAKIVYSLFDDKFDGTLDARFVEKLKQEGFSDEELAPLGDSPVDIIALNKLAIKYADGIIQASGNIPAELIEYAKSLGKPFLPYEGEEINAKAVVDFYESL